ncbi:hypothetical protein C0U40_04430 [Amylibacter cionae]|nr:hypothetical protein C0U40_04430 [Amylibacter cionae]
MCLPRSLRRHRLLCQWNAPDRERVPAVSQNAGKKSQKTASSGGCPCNTVPRLHTRNRIFVLTPTETALAETFEATSASFGGRLQAAREAKGLTVQGLSEKLGVQPETIEQWESDEDSPRSNRISMLAGLLNVSIIWLITGESNGTSNIEDSYDRPVAINDALGEIAQLKETLAGALEKLEQLETRLQDAN